MAKSIVLMGWTTIEKKQIYQIQSFSMLGYDVIVFTNDTFGNSECNVTEAAPNAIYIRLGASPLERIISVVSGLAGLKDSIAVIAPCGRFSLMYYYICRMLGLRVICIEWGDINFIETCDAITRHNMKTLYRCADLVWYKEPVMLNRLREYCCRNEYFLPNAVGDICVDSDPCVDVGYDFIWVNRFIESRYPEWFAKSINLISKNSSVNGVMVGVLDASHCDYRVLRKQKLVGSILSPRTVLLNYQNPVPLYKRSKYFVLAAETVFGNNSLLEAMLCGLVPIVTDSPGIDLLIDHEVNGFIVPRSELGLYNGMKYAVSLTDQKYQAMSRAAQETVRSKYSVSVWRGRAENMLMRLEA